MKGTALPRGCLTGIIHLHIRGLGICPRSSIFLDSKTSRFRRVMELRSLAFKDTKALLVRRWRDFFLSARYRFREHDSRNHHLRAHVNRRRTQSRLPRRITGHVSTHYLGCLQRKRPFALHQQRGASRSVQESAGGRRPRRESNASCSRRRSRRSSDVVQKVVRRHLELRHGRLAPRPPVAHPDRFREQPLERGDVRGLVYSRRRGGGHGTVVVPRGRRGICLAGRGLSFLAAQSAMG